MVAAHRLEDQVLELAGFLEASGEQHWSYLLRSAARDVASDLDRGSARLRTLVEGRGGLAALRVGNGLGRHTPDEALNQARFEALRDVIRAELNDVRSPARRGSLSRPGGVR